MKTYCKDVDISSRELISVATYRCIEGKYKRQDTLKLMSVNSGLLPSQVYNIMYRYGQYAVYWIIENIIDSIREEIQKKTLHFIPIWHRYKKDISSGKIRKIGIQNIKQQIYDYIAVIALEPILKRIGEHQYAMKGKGPIHGAVKIKKWLKNKKITHIGQMDVKKCYDSISVDNMMKFLEKYIKNKELLWLIWMLISTFDGGLSIGSYLSQFLCDLYISQIYHEIKERMFRIRKKKDGTQKRVNLVRHLLIYRDDMLILGTRARDIHMAIKKIMKYIKDMGLELKESWKVFQIKRTTKRKHDEFADMMGFRMYRDKLTMRRRISKRTMRAYRRVAKKIRMRKKVPIELARRCMSYWGNIKNTDSRKFMKKYHVKKCNSICRKVVSEHDKSKVYRGTAVCLQC